MKTRTFSKGEVSLGYLLKYGLGAGLVLLINTAFDQISGTLYTYQVQLMAASPYVRSVKDCVYQTLLAGSYSRLDRCEQRGGRSYDGHRSEAVEIGLNGEIRLTRDINGKTVNLVLTPTFGADQKWQCTGQGSYVPESCRKRRD